MVVVCVTHILNEEKVKINSSAEGLACLRQAGMVLSDDLAPVFKGGIYYCRGFKS